MAWAFKLVWAKMTKKKIEIEENIFGMGLQQQLRFLVVPLGLHPSPLGPC